VQFTCDEHFTKSTKEDIECVLGMLKPRAPACRARGEETWFKAGGDITVDGGLSPMEVERRACAPPARVQGSLIYKVSCSENNVNIGIDRKWTHYQQSQ